MPGMNDWAVVGGRWSGMLSNGELDPTRDPYRDLGYENDALLLTKDLYAKYLQCFEQKLQRTGRNQTHYLGQYDRMGGFVDLDNELLSQDFICRKWLVLVDVHS